MQEYNGYTFSDYTLAVYAAICKKLRGKPNFRLDMMSVRRSWTLSYPPDVEADCEIDNALDVAREKAGLSCRQDFNPFRKS